MSYESPFGIDIDLDMIGHLNVEFFALSDFEIKNSDSCFEKQFLTSKLF